MCLTIRSLNDLKNECAEWRHFKIELNTVDGSSTICQVMTALSFFSRKSNGINEISTNANCETTVRVSFFITLFYS